MQIDLHRLAESDLLEGHRFYEEQSSGLGDYFLDSLFADLESLRLHAGMHRKVFGFHRLLARTFPFCIYYRVEEGRVLVFRILDCRQNPARHRSGLGR